MLREPWYPRSTRHNRRNENHRLVLACALIAAAYALAETETPAFLSEISRAAWSWLFLGMGGMVCCAEAVFILVVLQGWGEQSRREDEL